MPLPSVRAFSAKSIFASSLALLALACEMVLPITLARFGAGVGAGSGSETGAGAGFSATSVVSSSSSCEIESNACYSKTRSLY